MQGNKLEHGLFIRFLNARILPECAVVILLAQYRGGMRALPFMYSHEVLRSKAQHASQPAGKHNFIARCLRARRSAHHSLIVNSVDGDPYAGLEKAVQVRACITLLENFQADACHLSRPPFFHPPFTLLPLSLFLLSHAHIYTHSHAISNTPYHPIHPHIHSLTLY